MLSSSSREHGRVHSGTGYPEYCTRNCRVPMRYSSAITSSTSNKWPELSGGACGRRYVLAERLLRFAGLPIATVYMVPSGLEAGQVVAGSGSGLGARVHPSVSAMEPPWGRGRVLRGRARARSVTALPCVALISFSGCFLRSSAVDRNLGAPKWSRPVTSWMLWMPTDHRWTRGRRLNGFSPAALIAALREQSTSYSRSLGPASSDAGAPGISVSWLHVTPRSLSWAIALSVGLCNL